MGRTHPLPSSDLFLWLALLREDNNKSETSSKKKLNNRGKMGAPRSWFSSVRKRLIKTSHRNINIAYSRSLSDQSIVTEAAKGQSANLECNDSAPSSSRPIPPQRKQITREDIAATKIQAVFRGHLARRAYRALKSLVKVQALVRGACVRKQARIALHCMHALVRLQVRVRAQQLLIRSRDD